MKRKFSLILLLSLLLSSFSSCSFYKKDGTYISSNITLTSSDAEEHKTFLADRLGELCGKVTLGIGNNKEYSIEMSAFEDDGYIIKTVGNETVIFGKTIDGLDRGCRRYANDIETGGHAKDTVYHEGHRIDEFLLFGLPIDKFTVFSAFECDDAISEFTRLTKDACGAVPSLSDTSDKHSNMIRFVLSDDTSLGSEGYRYYESGQSLIFECMNADAAVSAVYGFFENECGWIGLSDGYPELAEQSVLDIPRDIDVTVTPAFEYFTAGEKIAFIPDSENDNVCFSDSTYYEKIHSKILSYAEECTSNGISPADICIPLKTDSGYCNCEPCQTVLLEEGSTAGTAVRFANKLSENIPLDLTYKIIAERSSDTPTKTTPNDRINIFAKLTDACRGHSLISEDCGKTQSRGKNFAGCVSGWKKLTDNVYVIINRNDSTLLQYTDIKNEYGNLKYLHGLGIKGVHIDADDSDLGLGEVERRLALLLSRNIDMTEEEYEDHLCRILETMYGDGYAQIREYIAILESAQISSCQGKTDPNYPFGFDTDVYKDYFDTVSGLIERGTVLACSSEQYKQCELLSCHVYYMGCLSSYFDAYYSSDKDRIAVLEERFSLAAERLEKHGYSISDSAIGCADGQLYDELYYAAWRNWSVFQEHLYDGDIPDNTFVTEFCSTVNENTAEDRLTFAFRSDSHYSVALSNSDKTRFATTIERENSIARYVDLDLFIHGGDLINGNESTNSSAAESIAEAVSVIKGIHAGTPMFFLRGNHDDNSWYGYEIYSKRYNSFPTDTIVTTEKWREVALNNQHVSFIIDDQGAYGYFDHEESKIRILLLDTSDIPYDDDGSGTYKYGAYTGHGIRREQLEFMAEAMTFKDKGDDASNWAILVASHVPVETLKTVDSEYRFGGLEASGRNFYTFLRLLKAYQRGTVFNETMTNPTNYGDGGYYSEQTHWDDTKGDFAYSIYADFSENGPGEVIGIVSGHTHIDNFSDEVGKVSYTGSQIYPDLSFGYPYFTVSNSGVSVFTVERNGDGTGTVFVNHLGESIVPHGNMISDGDNATESLDPTFDKVITSKPDSGTVASGSYTVNYSQNR